MGCHEQEPSCCLAAREEIETQTPKASIKCLKAGPFTGLQGWNMTLLQANEGFPCPVFFSGPVAVVAEVDSW